MNETQRQQVRENAKYLRQVRPVDPEEIYEYIDEQPHPAAVRQVLREQAPELGLLERDDGRFEPVGDEPVSVPFHGVDELPEEVSRAVEDALVERFGPGWPDRDSGEALRSSIRDFKRRYLTGATVTYDDVTALGYAIYHVPAYFATVQYVIGELVADGLVPKQLRVLDVGAGVGGPALGLDALLPDDALVEYHAIEPSDAVDLLSTMLETTGRNFHTRVHHLPVEEFDPSEALDSRGDTGHEFDLILFGNVLSELSDPGQAVVDSLSWLASDGTVVAIAPADRNTATQLREVERTVEREGDATVYAPTVRLWPNEQPESESWSFRKHPDIAIPSFQRRLDEGERTMAELATPGDDERRSDATDVEQAARTSADAEAGKEQSSVGDSTGQTSGGDGTVQSSGGGGAKQSSGGDDTGQSSGGDDTRRPPGTGEFVNVDVQYAYSLLRRDGRTAIEGRPNRSRVAKMKETERHVTERVDYMAIKLSHDLTAAGNPLYLVGDGSQKIDHFAVLTRESALNRDLATAEYGDLLLFENVLVLWNDDERAYNLVVDHETYVERIPA